MTIVMMATSFNKFRMIKPIEFSYHALHFSYALSMSFSTDSGSDQPLIDAERRWFRKPVPASTRTLADIWAGLSIETFHSDLLRQEILSARKNATWRANIRPVNPIDEQTRYEAYSRLRQRMFELVRGENCDSRRGWIRAFERWQYLSKNYEWGDIGKKSPSYLASLDPLLPSLAFDNPAEVSLFEDLSKLDGMSADAAKRVSQKIQADSSNLSSALYKRMILRTQKADAAAELTEHNKDRQSKEEENVRTYNTDVSNFVDVVSNQYNGDLKLSLLGDVSVESYSRRFRVFSISANHADKLQLLWNHRRSESKTVVLAKNVLESDVRGATAARSGYESSTDNNRNADTDTLQMLYNDMFCLLVRYSVLEGYGWQAAIAQPVLAALSKNFGVTVECFSSPLNSYLPSYCSFFPDTDAAFGSLGSFFDFHPLEGSFEANPPFVTTLMVQMVLRMDLLLAAATGPMSFAVVVPAWTEDAHWPLLLNSNFNMGHFVVTAAEHSYCDGRQHDNSIDEKYRPAPFDTAVFFLQNNQGAEKWPLTSDSKAELKKAFAAAKPSKESMQGKGIYIPKFKREREL